MNPMSRLLSVSIALAALSFGATFFDFSGNARPISTWGAICSSQPDQLVCCQKMLKACRQGCQERGDCAPNACEAQYNYCLQRVQSRTVNGTPPLTARRP
jgi:hypothetical protein